MHYVHIAGMRSNAAESEQVQNSLKLSTLSCWPRMSLCALVAHYLLSLTWPLLPATWLQVHVGEFNSAIEMVGHFSNSSRI